MPDPDYGVMPIVLPIPERKNHIVFDPPDMDEPPRRKPKKLMPERIAKRLMILRGIPGSGKTTLATMLSHAAGIMDESVTHAEADQYFLNLYTGEYKFNKEKLPDAHEFCRSKVQDAMIAGINLIIVSNTFVYKMHMEPYKKMAREYGYHVAEIICQGGFKNVHDVPDDVIRKMRQNFEF
jgi:tRNA uridine 5-carbamoylmethylation protein Kti12